ncbi:TPA: hypothetical protein ACH3X2_008949 [Trebouxia sp. C0005]
MQIPPDDSVDWTPLMDEQRSEGCAARSLTPPRKRVARTMTAPGSVRTGRWEAHIWEDGKQLGLQVELMQSTAADEAAVQHLIDAFTKYGRTAVI